MKTRTYKDLRNNWVSETSFDAPELGPNRFVRVHTGKNYTGELTTMVSVNQWGEDKRSYTHKVFADFCRTVAREKARCTEKAVTTQHQQVMAHIESIKRDAAEHYGVTVTA